MNIIENPPDWQAHLKNKPDLVLKMIQDENIHRILKKANSEYLYWDKFKYLHFPRDISSEEAWSFLKFSRLSQQKMTPIKDKEWKSFWYWLPDIVLKNLSLIDQQATGNILVSDPVISQKVYKENFLISSIMEEAIASSQLEGASTTRKKAKEMLKKGVRPKNKPEQMIYNNFHTIKWLKEMIHLPLSSDLIKEIQKRITSDTLDDDSCAGNFQTPDEERIHVGLDDKIIFTPPPADEIESRIKALCAFANSESKDEFIHPILKAILLHFWLAYIHPFSDGNGRTARALFYWYMLKNNYWLFEYLSISRIVLKAPAQYVRAYLYTETDDLDLTYFIFFHLRVILLSINDLKHYLMNKQKAHLETRELEEIFPELNPRQMEVIRHALKHPDTVYTIKTHQNSFKIVYQTARNDLLTLEKNLLFKRKIRGNKFVFIPAPLLLKRHEEGMAS